MSAVLCTADLTLACSNGKARYILVTAKNDLHITGPVTVEELEASIVAQLKVLAAMAEGSPIDVVGRVNMQVLKSIADDMVFDEELSNA